MSEQRKLPINATPQLYTDMARRALYMVLAEDAKGAHLETLVNHAVSQMFTANNLIEKYYVDVRAFSAFISSVYGEEKLKEICEMYNDFRNSK
jgi:hypothetical protein